MISLPIGEALDLAIEHQQAGRLHEAQEIYGQILSQQPTCCDALNLNGVVSAQLEQPEMAIELIGKAISLKPHIAEYHYNLANVFLDTQQYDQAVAAFARATEIKPRFFGAYNRMAEALRRAGRFREVIPIYVKAIECAPNPIKAHMNLGMALLLDGELERGWAEYDWRLTDPNYFSPPQHSISFWDGSPLDGKTILVHAEEGVGDVIQFARYVPLIAARGGKVTLQCQPELFRLMGTLAGAERILIKGQQLESIDAHALLLSLPRTLGTQLHSIPAEVPYLKAEPGLVEAWAGRFKDSHRRLRVGLTWAGSPTHGHDHMRSMALSQLGILATVGEVDFYSLQKGSAAAEAETAPAGMELIDLTAHLIDFAETAALIEHLDLVITVDTAVAHLAGALGKPVWILLPFVPDWRWMLDREDSPWYPTARLFRQKSMGDWGHVLGRVVEALVEQVQAHSKPPG